MVIAFLTELDKKKTRFARVRAARGPTQVYCRTPGDLSYQPHQLDLPSEASLLILAVGIRLLIKDITYRLTMRALYFCPHTLRRSVTAFYHNFQSLQHMLLPQWKVFIWTALILVFNAFENSKAKTNSPLILCWSAFSPF